jgi:hypothetical protein
MLIEFAPRANARSTGLEIRGTEIRGTVYLIDPWQFVGPLLNRHIPAGTGGSKITLFELGILSPELVPRIEATGGSANSSRSTCSDYPLSPGDLS